MLVCCIQDLEGRYLADRPYMYTCGMSDRVANQTGFGDLSNGGIFAFDVTDSLNPVDLHSIHLQQVFYCMGG